MRVEDIKNGDKMYLVVDTSDRNSTPVPNFELHEVHVMVSLIKLKSVYDAYLYYDRKDKEEYDMCRISFNYKDKEYTRMLNPNGEVSSIQFTDAIHRYGQFALYKSREDAVNAIRSTLRGLIEYFKEKFDTAKKNYTEIQQQKHWFLK